MPEARETFQLIARSDDAHRRLDCILALRVTSVSRLSRSMAQRWIESGAVTVDGRAATRASLRVRAGAAISVQLPPSTVFRQPPRGEPVAFVVLYEDEAVIVADKPAGMVVHPTYKSTSGTLLNAVLWHLGAHHLQAGIVTRLDKDTSGIVLIAKTADAHAALQRAPQRMRKEYLAVVCGWPRPRSGVIRHALGRDPGDRRRVIVTASGAASETRYEVVSRWEREGREALVRCELVTGRSHQIRVHLASEGWPVLGDRGYGRADSRITRQALHAWRLTFAHPGTGRVIEVESPLPPDMRAIMGHEEHERVSHEGHDDHEGVSHEGHEEHEG
jgi:23S rRNA pseudouridine1911/1915/1917 synthase